MDISAGQSVDLILTGERTLPGIWHENYWFRRHEAVYHALAGSGVAGALLEAGCGEGYGADLLRVAGARAVLALDYDAATVEHVRRRYPLVHVVRGNLVALPCPNASVDTVVSLQTVEHVWDRDRFARECARVLRPGGTLVVSTPNRLTFSPGVGRGEKPLNPFHVVELDAEELHGLLAPNLRELQVLGLHHGCRIAAWEADRGPIVDALLARPPEAWPADLADLVTSLEADDFRLDDQVETSLDLVAWGVR